MTTPFITGTIQKHYLQEMHLQNKFPVSMWCGIWNGQLIGPVFYEETLTATKYIENILNGIETVVLETSPLSFAKSLHFQQDGPPARKAVNGMKWINQNFAKQ